LARDHGHRGHRVGRNGRRGVGETFWRIADERCQAGGALLAGYHELQAKKQAHESRVQQTELAKALARAEELRGATQHSASRRGFTTATSRPALPTLVPTGDAGAYEQTGSGTLLPTSSAGETTDRRQPLAKAKTAALPGPSSFPMAAAETAAVIEESTADDMATRREFLAALAVLSGVALITPVRQWATTVPVALPPSLGNRPEELTEIERAVSFFRRWDSAGNGGLHRKAVVGQLNATAESLVRAACAQGGSASVCRRQFHVAAQLLQLTGWMCYDEGLYGQAQKYQFLGLHATHHAHAPELGAKIIGDMTQLSTALGNYDDSLGIVRTALSVLPRQANPLVRSELHGLEARALAHLGSDESSHARRAIEACVEVFHSGATGDKPDWLHYMTPAEVGCLAANTYIQLALQATRRGQAKLYASEAEQHTIATIRSRGSGYNRSAVLDSLRLSKVRIAQGVPEEAARVASSALEGTGAMTSTVVVTWLIDLHQVLMCRYATAPGTDSFHNELADYLSRVAPEKQGELVAHTTR
jgi:hypothetical protein